MQQRVVAAAAGRQRAWYADRYLLLHQTQWHSLITHISQKQRDNTCKFLHWIRISFKIRLNCFISVEYKLYYTIVNWLIHKNIFIVDVFIDHAALFLLLYFNQNHLHIKILWLPLQPRRIGSGKYVEYINLKNGN